MHRLSVWLLVAASIGFGAPAHAETHTFMVSGTDGYGVDQCLAEGKPCGQPAAAAWCRSRDYVEVQAYGRVAPEDITASVPSQNPIATGRRDDVVAITCTR